MFFARGVGPFQLFGEALHISIELVFRQYYLSTLLVMLSTHASHLQDEFYEDAIEQKEVEDMEETQEMEEGDQDEQNKEIHEEDREKEEEACSENMESFT